MALGLDSNEFQIKICCTVIPGWKEPIPGWVDSLNGPVGLLIGAGKGVVRTMLADPDYLGDFNPVDIVCNGLIVASWKTATEM